MPRSLPGEACRPQSLLQAAMKSFTHAVLVAMLISLAAAKSAEEREGRSWFGGEHKPVTKVYLKKHIVTSAVPSSCVVVAPSLPACRNLRALNIEPEPTVQVARIEPTKAPMPSPEGRDGRTFWSSETTAPPLRRHQVVVSSSEETPAIDVEEVDLENIDLEEAAKATTTTEAAHGESWGEMLGLAGEQHTVSRFLHRTVTRTVIDPSLVVTFSVTGCEPTRLPFDLEFCDKSKAKHSKGKDKDKDKPVKEVSSPHVITIQEADA